LIEVKGEIADKSETFSVLNCLLFWSRCPLYFDVKGRRHSLIVRELVGGPFKCEVTHNRSNKVLFSLFK